ncbi:DUF6959 family protein [Micromonospora violae]|uniref:DUF6959 family protein n=1 Tax=Micromonospora violae TaxID=1278207 RepID=UPI0033D1EEE5
MEQERAEVLSRAGNYAVVHLLGRAFPGLHVQGDTLAALRTQLAGAARALRERQGDAEVLDELDATVEDIDAMLSFYAETLSRHGIKRPY